MRIGMHIGLVCDEYAPARSGGIGSFTRDLAEGLVRRGHRVTVVGVYAAGALALQGVSDEVRGGVRVVRLPSWTRLPARARLLADRLRLSRWLRRAHREAPFDLIECPDFGGWLAFGAPAGVPTVARLHGAGFVFDEILRRRNGRLVGLLERRWIDRADRLAAVSAFIGEKTMAVRGGEARPVEVIHNAVDTERFAPAPGDAVEEGLIVFTGSIAAKKGVRELCLAMNSVLRDFPHARLALVGKLPAAGTPGAPDPEALLDLVDPAFRPRVHFTGAVDRERGVLGWLRRAHVCCYPSHVEAFAIAPLEAMAVGRPTVFTRLVSGAELIEDDVSGLLCDPRDPADIAEKIGRVLRDPGLAERLGRRGRQRIVRHFDGRRWISRNIAFYATAIREA